MELLHLFTLSQDFDLLFMESEILSSIIFQMNEHREKIVIKNNYTWHVHFT